MFVFTDKDKVCMKKEKVGVFRLIESQESEIVLT